MESKDGRMGFKGKVLVDFLTCQNGFSATIGQKHAVSRADAVSFGNGLVKLDLIHHYRDASEFGDDDGFFRFLDDEPASYFEKRQTVLSFRSPCRTVRPGKVLWACEDILLGSDLEVRNGDAIPQTINNLHFIRSGTVQLFCFIKLTAGPGCTRSGSIMTSSQN